MFRKIRGFLVGALFTTLIVLGAVKYLDARISQPAILNVSKATVSAKTARLPSAEASDVQLSQDDQYIAYKDNEGLKVYNTKTSKIVFQEVKNQIKDTLIYEWLPDKNILLFISHASNQTNQSSAKALTSSSKTSVSKSGVPELYSVDFSGETSSDTTYAVRSECKLSNYPQDGVVEQMSLSTYTNLIYLTVKTGSSEKLLQIDVMRNIVNIAHPGEKISRISASDEQGTLYIQSVYNGVAQIVAVKQKTTRQQLFMGSQYVLLGQESNKVMIGVLANGNLTKVLSLPDTGLSTKANSETTMEWEGNIPWKNYQVTYGNNGTIVLYDTKEAIVLDHGNQKNITMKGSSNFITLNGQEIVEVTPGETDTTVSVSRL